MPMKIMGVAAIMVTGIDAFLVGTVNEKSPHCGFFHFLPER